jgi:two-component system heavy metal sensor histidine kinase CusS
VRPAVDLWIGIDSEPYTHALQRFAWRCGSPAGWACCWWPASGYWIARLGWPLRALSDEARSLSPQRLSQRLAPGLPAELGHLTMPSTARWTGSKRPTRGWMLQRRRRA